MASDKCTPKTSRKDLLLADRTRSQDRLYGSRERSPPRTRPIQDGGVGNWRVKLLLNRAGLDERDVTACIRKVVGEDLGQSYERSTEGNLRTESPSIDGRLPET